MMIKANVFAPLLMLGRMHDFLLMFDDRLDVKGKLQFA